MSDVSNKEFAQRLHSACDNHPDAPPAGQGRIAWLAGRVDVSAEAARKWFAGQSRPRPKVMTKLADALDADEAWLALGITPLRDRSEKRTFTRAASGAVYLVAGLLEMEGGKVAFPDDAADTPADLHAIIDQRNLNIHVAVAERIGVGRFRLTLPHPSEQVVSIAVFPGRDLVPRLMLLPQGDVARYGDARGGFVELEVLADDGAFVTQDFEWPRITSFHTPLSAYQTATA